MKIFINACCSFNSSLVFPNIAFYKFAIGLIKGFLVVGVELQPGLFFFFLSLSKPVFTQTSNPIKEQANLEVAAWPGSQMVPAGSQ